MSRLLRAIALVLAVTFSLFPGFACAETQLALVQRTFDALNQSSAALDRGDFARAQSLLAGIRSSAEALQGNAERFALQAKETDVRTEANARRTADLIAQTVQAEQAADREIQDLDGKIADSKVQIDRANQTRVDLENQMKVYQQEVAMRNECKSRFMDGLFWNTECWRLGWADLTQNRVDALNRDIKDNVAQLSDIQSAQFDLTRRLSDQQERLRSAQTRKVQLEAELQELDQRIKTLKAAVVSLTNASFFWKDTATLIRSKVMSIDTLQQNLRILAGRAQATSTAPVFDSYDKEEVRTLQATLIDFARTLDKGTNILLSQR